MIWPQSLKRGDKWVSISSVKSDTKNVSLSYDNGEGDGISSKIHQDHCTFRAVKPSQRGCLQHTREELPSSEGLLPKRGANIELSFSELVKPRHVPWINTGNPSCPLEISCHTQLTLSLNSGLCPDQVPPGFQHRHMHSPLASMIHTTPLPLPPILWMGSRLWTD